MNKQEFPLIEAMGIVVHNLGSDEMPGCYVVAHQLEKLLESAPRVYGYSNTVHTIWSSTKDEDAKEGVYDTHTARLLCVQPVVRDTAESLLREWQEWFATTDGKCRPDLRERTKRLLEKGEG
jgi:hypothetical protein